MIFSSPYFWRTDYTHRQGRQGSKGAVFDKMTELCALEPASRSRDDDGYIDDDMSHSQMLGKVESGGGPIFKVVLEC